MLILFKEIIKSWKEGAIFVFKLVQMLKIEYTGRCISYGKV